MRTAIAVAILSTVALFGCASTVDPVEGTPMPSFALVDANETSPTFDQAVSVDDLRGRVGAWYFGHAT